MEAARRGGPDIPEHVLGALDDFAGRLRRRFEGRVGQVRLFGSYARGDFHAESDVDVLVVVHGLTERERRETFEAAYEVYLERWVDISPLSLSSAEWSDRRARELRLVADIEREGIAL